VPLIVVLPLQSTIKNRHSSIVSPIHNFGLLRCFVAFVAVLPASYIASVIFGHVVSILSESFVGGGIVNEVGLFGRMRYTCWVDALRLVLSFGS
jgi:hypothetical protein